MAKHWSHGIQVGDTAVCEFEIGRVAFVAPDGKSAHVHWNDGHDDPIFESTGWRDPAGWELRPSDGDPIPVTVIRIVEIEGGFLVGDVTGRVHALHQIAKVLP